VSPSLLDRIYCKLRNTTQIAGIAIFDVLDHLQIFLLLSTSVNRKSDKQIIRCMKNFNLENFLLTLIFQTIINKHAPLRKLSRREKQLQAKPWITR